MTAKSIRKKYQKPVINQVNLVPEEAVLTACKLGQAGENKGGNKICGHGSLKCPDASGS